MEFLFNHAVEDFHFNILLDVLPENEQQHNADNNENHENHDDNNNNDNNENHDDNDFDNNENHDDNDFDNNENHDDNDIDNDENHDNNDHNNNVDDNVDNIDNPNVGQIDIDNESAEEAGTSAWVEVGIGANQCVEEDDPLPGQSRRRSREEDGQDLEERSSKRFRWWDEFAESSTDSDSDNTDYADNDTDKNTGNSPVRPAGAGAEVSEQDPLPGPSRKRSLKHDKKEDERSSNKSRLCYKFADSTSDTVTGRTGHDLAHSSSSINLAEGAGAAEETNEDVNLQVEEEEPRPMRCRKRSRKSDDREDRKRFKR